MPFQIFSNETSLTDFVGEEWLPISGYEDCYMVSNLARVKSLKRLVIRKNGMALPLKERILKPSITEKGYHCVGLCKDCIVTSFLVYKIVADTFIPNPENKKCVNHINGIKTHSCVYNIEHSTHSENSQHAYKSGLINPKKGILNGMCKLTVSEVLNIVASSKTCKELADIYSVSDVQISNIKNGTSWTHITSIQKKESRLSKEVVIEIYKSADSADVLSKKFSTSRDNIWNIKKGKTFSSISGFKP